jgi:transposase-like protein
MATRYREGRGRYAFEQKIALVEEIERRYQTGKGSIAAIARELGLPSSTVFDWRRDIAARQAKEGTEKARAEFLRVDISALPPVAPEPLAFITPTKRETLTLFAPSGHWVEGLSLESTVALLRALL